MRLATLQRCYRQAFGEHAVQLVTILGEPGVGKSRLVRELAGFVDAQPELVAWRRGRCLSFGGLSASGPSARSSRPRPASWNRTTRRWERPSWTRRSGAVADDASEREWLKARLAPLVGFVTASEAAASRDESFMAWRRFLQLVATRGPLILVIEDLHWADPAMLEFLEQLLDQAGPADLLMVVTARPELLDRHPGWGTGRPNATTVSLAPLDDERTAVLLGALLGQSMLPAEAQSLLLERAGGNPLYAEEFVRLLTDQGLLTERGNLVRVRPAIAGNGAGLDRGAPGHPRAGAQDPAPGRRRVRQGVLVRSALAAMGSASEAEVRAGLAQLERKELIRAARLSAVENEAEYSFWHAIVRGLRPDPQNRPFPPPPRGRRVDPGPRR